MSDSFLGRISKFLPPDRWSSNDEHMCDTTIQRADCKAVPWFWRRNKPRKHFQPRESRPPCFWSIFRYQAVHCYSLDSYAFLYLILYDATELTILWIVYSTSTSMYWCVHWFLFQSIHTQMCIWLLDRNTPCNQVTWDSQFIYWNQP